MLVITNEVIQGYDIIEYFGHVSETVTFYCFQPMSKKVTDRSPEEDLYFKKRFKEAERILIENLKRRAEKMGGNAILGLRINYGGFYDDVLATGTGTVVKIVMTEEQKIKIERQKQREYQECKNYIFNMTAKELIKYLENGIFEYDKKIVKNIVLERRDLKENIKEYSEYENEVLETMKEYSELAKIILLLREME